jgi:hypothetical protein
LRLRAGEGDARAGEDRGQGEERSRPRSHFALRRKFALPIFSKNRVTYVMILKIFSPTKSAEKLAFSTPNKAELCKILIRTLFFFLEKRQFFAKNCRKSQKIVIIISTPEIF